MPAVALRSLQCHELSNINSCTWLSVPMKSTCCWFWLNVVWYALRGLAALATGDPGVAAVKSRKCQEVSNHSSWTCPVLAMKSTCCWPLYVVTKPVSGLLGLGEGAPE